ncbi:MAG TPA: DUF4129 domain-containing protein [Dehalococcoidia bacterium]|nr:DUF4129 domain-containing protein [Dehalococcoidia bacterium]
MSSNPLTALPMGGAILGALISGATVELQDLKVLVNEANLPPTFRLIAKQMVELSVNLMDTLKRTDIALQETESALDQGLLEKSKEQLGRTQALIQQGDDLVAELQAATDQLIRIVPVVQAPLSDAFAQFEQERERFRTLWQRYQSRIGGVKEQIAIVEEQGTPTALLMNPTQPDVIVGQNLLVTGILSAGGEGLPGRDVELFFGERPAGSFTTEDDGSFTIQMPVPLLYVPSAQLEARYIPQGEDNGVFRGSSAATDVKLIYFATSLQVEAPAAAYPGRSMIIIANIDATRPPSPERRVTVAVAGTQVAEAQCGRRCELTVPIPPDTQLGEQWLSAIVAAEGPYDEVSQDVTLSITQIPVRVDLRTSFWTFVPGEVRLQGSVDASSEPVEQGAIAVRFGALSDTLAVQGGVFSGHWDLPPSLVIGGPQPLEVTFRPKDPWLAQAAVRRSVFFVNLWSSVLLAAILAMASMGYVARRTWHEKQRRPVPSVAMAVQNQQGRVATSQTGSWGVIVGEFWRAVHLVAQLLSIKTQPSTTLREFLALVEGRLGRASRAFQRLTGMMEEALYSPRRPDAAQAKEAEVLAKEVERTIKDA